MKPRRKSKTTRKSSTVIIRIPVNRLSLLECGIHDAADLHDRLAERPRNPGDSPASMHRRSSRYLRELAEEIARRMPK